MRYKVAAVLVLGIFAGYFYSIFMDTGTHAQCIDSAEAEISLKNLDSPNRFEALALERKKCDQKYEVKLNADDMDDLGKAMMVSSSLKFGDDGLHHIFVKNKNPDFIVTNLRVGLKMLGENAQSTAKTGYIRVMPNSESFAIKLNTSIYETSDLSNDNFQFSLLDIWGVKVRR